MNIRERIVAKLRFEMSQKIEDIAISILKRKVNADKITSGRRHFRPISRLLEPLSPKISLTLEGGIGQQLFIYLYFLYLRENNINVQLNLNDSGSQVYRLNEFGICKKSLFPGEKSVSASGGRFMVKFNSRLLFKLLPQALLEIKESWSKKVFEMDHNLKSIVLKRFEGLHGRAIDKFTILHLRRGDFHEKGIRIIDFDYYISTILDIKGLYQMFDQDFELLIASDSTLGKLEYEALKKQKLKFKFLQDFSDIETHILMQECGILICSNSSFSLSAAFMRKEQKITFLPREFYSGHDGGYFNLLIRKIINFGVLSKKDF